MEGKIIQGQHSVYIVSHSHKEKYLSVHMYRTFGKDIIKTQCLLEAS